VALMRVCSLLPSATEIVAALGAADQLVAITHECDYPPEVIGLPMVTRSVLDHSLASSGAIDRHIRAQLHAGSSLYHLDAPRLAELKPDLILTQELCRVCAVAYESVVGTVRQLPGEPRVVSLEPHSLEDVFASIETVGRLLAREDAASSVVAELRRRVERVTQAVAGRARPKVFVMEWADPIYNSGHWIPELVRLAGGQDPLGVEGRPSGPIAWELVRAAAPEVLLLAPCGFTLERAFAEIPELSRRPGWGDLPAVRTGRVFVADGSAYFSRPGPRLVDSLELLAAILHPDSVPAKASPGALRRVA
jgi:iron complex transport system substrate-binding protein